MAEQIFRVGLVGLGIAGMSHYVSLWEHAEVRIAAVCRENPAELRAFCETHGIKSGYTDITLMLAEQTLDGIIIATPHDVLASHLLSALGRCRVILVEKPMATSETEAAAIERAWADSGTDVIVGFPRRYRNHYRAAMGWIRSRALGTVRQVTCEWCDEHTEQYGDPSPVTFRGDPRRAVRGALLDHGSHLLDAALWLSESQPMYVSAATVQTASGIDSQAQMIVTSAQGALIASLYGSSPALKRRRICMTASDGRIDIDDRSATLTAGAEAIEVLFDGSGRGPVDDFINVLRGNPQVGCTVPEALRVVRTIDAAYRSASDGCCVMVSSGN